MNVADISRENFRRSESSRENQTDIIYDYIAENPDCTDLEISLGTGIPINAVPSARLKLFNEGNIMPMGKKTNSTGSQAIKWRVMIGGQKPTVIDREECGFCAGGSSTDCTWCDGTGFKVTE